MISWGNTKTVALCVLHMCRIILQTSFPYRRDGFSENDLRSFQWCWSHQASEWHCLAKNLCIQWNLLVRGPPQNKIQHRFLRPIHSVLVIHNVTDPEQLGCTFATGITFYRYVCPSNNLSNPSGLCRFQSYHHCERKYALATYKRTIKLHQYLT